MRHHLMTWFAKRRKIDTDPIEGQTIVSKAFSKIQELISFQARRYRMIDASPDNVFEVLSLNSNKSYTVKLEFQTCTCLEWESTGIPCSHAIAAILFNKENPQTYAKAFFSLDGYRRTYANAIFAPDSDLADNTQVPAYLSLNGDGSDEDSQPSNILAPPHVRRAAGRPRNRRIRSGIEGPFGNKRSYKCGRCGKFGHPERTCDSAI